MIYLDNAATTKPRKEVVSTIFRTLSNTWGNPSSNHKIGTKAKEVIETSRKEIATHIGARNLNEIIFTSGACESNSLALNLATPDRMKIISSKIEHKSIWLNPLVEQRIRVDKEGFVDLEELYFECRAAEVAKKIPFVSIQWANGEIGTIQDMKKITQIVHSHGGIVHSDATQIIADRKINVKKADVDLMSFSGQKIGATKGIGCLYINEDRKISKYLNPLIYGSQEKGLRGGTENVPYIAGLATAFNLLEAPSSRVRDYFVEKMSQSFPNIKFIGTKRKQNRLKNNAAYCFEDYRADEILTLLENFDIYASAGSACESGTDKPSRVLKAIGISDRDAKSTIRFTFGKNNTKEEADVVIHNLDRILESLTEHEH